MPTSSCTSRTAVLFLTLALTGLAGGGCGRGDSTRASTSETGAEEMVAATARVGPRSGSGASGTVRFVREANGIRVTAELTGLTPGAHGFHIHENGDCSAPDASTAGDHFNPTGVVHGDRDSELRHVGDLGNLVAGEDGRARIDFVDTQLRLDGPHSIVGRAVIVHAGPDDGRSQPSGNAGERVACGIIILES